MSPVITFAYSRWFVTIGGHAVSLPYLTIGGARLARWARLNGRPIR